MDETRWGALEWGTYADAFGYRLVVIRKARGYSQETLAERSGMHRNQISNLERGTSNREPHVADPLLSTVYRLAGALDVPPAYLMPDLRSAVATRSFEQSSRAELSAVETALRDVLEHRTF
ncbi:helix-turn-helix domain-containing protein [Gordonia sp. HY285]|uniref:helix-turn-helix domain-containing protein n=1 Tax=Gordonia liuliyuniae TaxID=2911517 RepID=UPI001F20F186|nr:helix-turn-helix transcriptional regulator [Gordonia liuliyuniae]MCF8611607.1 helix-turn-helix domain-containing protein [Gordonia liuliyuniae]